MLLIIIDVWFLQCIGASIPKVAYTLNEQQKDALLKWLKILRFPDGYVSNLVMEHRYG